jgi:hypothetical protein
VAVVTPAVYQAFAESGLGPRLKPPVERLRFPWRFQAARALLGRNLTAMLRPGSVQRLAAEGGTGVPLFGEDELHAFVSEANEEPPDRPRHGRWWEFWPTTEGSYAMFPGDDARRSSVATTLWIPAGRSAHVRRIDLSSLLLVRRRGSLLTAGGPPHDGPESADRPIVPPEPCELLAEEVEPGAPYVGRCSNVGCAGGCSPHVVVLPDDGVYRLLGCDC